MYEPRGVTLRIFLIAVTGYIEIEVLTVSAPIKVDGVQPVNFKIIIGILESKILPFCV